MFLLSWCPFERTVDVRANMANVGVVHQQVVSTKQPEETSGTAGTAGKRHSKLNVSQMYPHFLHFPSGEGFSTLCNLTNPKHVCIALYNHIT